MSESLLVYSSFKPIDWHRWERGCILGSNNDNFSQMSAWGKSEYQLSNCSTALMKYPWQTNHHVVNWSSLQRIPFNSQPNVTVKWCRVQQNQSSHFGFRSNLQRLCLQSQHGNLQGLVNQIRMLVTNQKLGWKRTRYWLSKHGGSYWTSISLLCFMI